MTTTALEGFDTVSTSGSAPGSWLNTSNLLYPTLGTATFSPQTIYKPTDRILLSVPSFASDIPAGAELDNLYVTYQVKRSVANGASVIKGKFLVTGGTTFSLSTIFTSFNSRTLDGDKDYWGWTSKTKANALADILDGTVKFGWNSLYTSAFGNIDTVSFKAPKIQITYTVPATSSDSTVSPGAPLLVAT